MLIPAALSENANAVIRSNEETYTINSQNSLTVRTVTACTVLNEFGLRNLQTMSSYSPTTRISKIEARVYDKMGNQLKVFKKKDFRDVSLADGFSIFSDNRMLYLDYTPIGYPFTMVLECEYQTSNTAQIPRWSALSGYFVSTESDKIQITYPENLGFAYKEVNFDPKFQIEKQQLPGKVIFTARNIPAVKGEAESPEFFKVSPIVHFRLDKFSLEGVDGQASNWKEFGQWYYERLLTGTDELSAETQLKVRQLIGDEKDQIKIARKIYAYVQDKTRYVSVQVGIGGYKPMKASDVDKLGYGDCKALSNYTRALLAAAGIPSYFTLVYAGDDSRRGLMPDFVSPQGNHAILAMPYQNGYVWMECTNQVSPFGFQGIFTDGRDVLVIKPEGGEIVRTKPMIEKDNSRVATGKYMILADGSISGLISTSSSGSAYDAVYNNQRLSAKEREKHYKESLDNIGSLNLEKIEFTDDRDAVRFTEKIAISAPNYASINGSRVMFAINAFNPFTDTPTRYRNRQNPFRVERGYLEQDEFEIAIPEGFDIEAIPSGLELKSKYGEYSSTVTRKLPNLLIYTRTFLMKDGSYPSEEYEKYRQFCEQVAKYDASKAVLIKKT